MYYNVDKFDWKTREYAETITRFRQIESDPERLRNAQACIQDSINSGKKALGIKVAPRQVGRSNPATIMKLNPKF